MLRRAVAWIGVVLAVLLPVPGLADHAATNCRPHPNGRANQIVCAGAGNDGVRIDGAVAVSANPAVATFGYADAGSNVANDGEEFFGPSASTAGAAAYGVLTGAGHDTVGIYGSLSAHAYGFAATAVDTSDGDDELALGNGSLTTGSVFLGNGDDTLRLIGTPTLNGGLDAGAGANSLIFENAGAFSNALAGFVNATKLGAGTYSLPTLATMTRLSVDDGVLSLGAAYAMGGGSTFTTRINGDGSFGQLAVNGNVGLAGALQVLQGSSGTASTRAHSASTAMR